MSDFVDEKFEKLIRDAVGPSMHELRRDLWPEMISRLRQPAIKVSWFDWVLAATVATICLLVPETLGALLFHL